MSAFSFLNTYINDITNLEKEISREDYIKIQIFIAFITMFLITLKISSDTLIMTLVMWFWFVINLAPQISINTRRLRSSGMTLQEVMIMVLTYLSVILKIILLIVFKISSLLYNLILDFLKTKDKNFINQKNNKRSKTTTNRIYSDIYPVSSANNESILVSKLLTNYPKVTKTKLYFSEKNLNNVHIRMESSKQQYLQSLPYIRSSGDPLKYRINLRANARLKEPRLSLNTDKNDSENINIRPKNNYNYL